MFINRSFFYLWVAQAISQFATNILLFFITFFIYKKTSSNIAVSAGLLVYLIPSFVSSMAAGVIVDRMGKKWILFVTTVCRAAFVFLMFLTAGNIVFVYVLIFLLAITTQFFTPAESSIIPHLVPLGRLVAANAYFAGTINVSLIAGFLLSPFFFKLFGFHTVVIISAAYAVSSAIIFLLPIEEPFFYTNFRQPMTAIVKKFIRHVSFIVKNFIRDKTINHCVCIIVMLQSVFFVLIAASPGFADKILKIPVEDLSFLIIFPTALGFLIASLVVGRMKKNDAPSLQFSSFMACGVVFITVFALAQLQEMMMFTLLNFFLFMVFGFFSGLVMIAAYADLQKNTTHSRRAGYFGILNAFINLGSAIPVFLSGILSDVFGVDKIALILAMVFLSVGWAMRRGVKS